MPRLPTTRVTGSHAISTRLGAAFFAFDVIARDTQVPFAVCSRNGGTLLHFLGRGTVCTGTVRRGAIRPDIIRRPPPLGFAIHRRLRETPESAYRSAVDGHRLRRELRPRRLLQERHELVGEAGHRAADANSADV